MSLKTGDCGLDGKIEEWFLWDKNEKTLSEIKKLVEEKKFGELSNILLNRLSFGTAGIRGKMGPGYARLNDLVIIQTGQGFLQYLEAKNLDLLKQNGIVIGYDGRHNSKRWAELTAAIFVNAGYPAKLFGNVVPTPFVPFSVTKYCCASGVMVTASHNPKEDNGYKVYGPNGAQIVTPADKDIQNCILANLKPLESSWNVNGLATNTLVTDPLDEVVEHYVKNISNSLLPEHKKINEQCQLPITYTAMHGVGYVYFQRVCDEIRIKIIPVVEQKDPDPEFPTVKFPNPEEGKSSLDLAFKTARENDSYVIIANDPDADRMGAAERSPKSCDWKIFTGNELGALLGWWLFHCYKLRCHNEPLNSVYMISSTVSSMILKTMSKAEGFNYIDTLTGFKWIGNKALDLENEGNKVLFCFEEAIGFMCSTKVLDKDGISAAAQFATMASYIYSCNKTITEQLTEIYATYGQHVSSNSYYICHEQAKIKQIFNRLRNFNGKDTYPKEILNNKYQIINVRDLTTGYDNNQSDNKAILPVSADTEMITFTFANGLICTLRTSGTEPKIKYYTEMCASPDIKDTKTIMNTLNEMVKGICEEMLEPQKNGLVAKTD